MTKPIIRLKRFLVGNDTITNTKRVYALTYKNKISKDDYQVRNIKSKLYIDTLNDKVCKMAESQKWEEVKIKGIRRMTVKKSEHEDKNE